MIYLAYLLLRYALLLALAFGVVLGVVFTFRAARRTHRALAGALLVLFLAPAFWLLYGWITFTVACDRILPLQRFTTVERQDTVLLQLRPGHGFMKDINIQLGSLLEAVGSVCTEQEFWRPITDPKTGKTFRFERDCVQNYRRVDYQRSNEPLSSYAIHVEARPSFASLGYMLSYRVQTIDGAQVVATAEEAIFGRGLLAWYIGMLVRSNNPEYMACGYADDSIRIFRDTRAGRGDARDDYFRVDLRLFQAAVGSAR